MAQPLRVEPVHDFTGKLRQPALFPGVLDYVAWQRSVRQAKGRGEPPPPMPDVGPLSINLDLTTACNYACDHCIDWDILNSGINHDEKKLRASMEDMARRGMKSVILIGGGEPTVYPGFAAFVRFLKSLDLQVAVVSNGSRNDRVLEVADVLDERDWVRLSLDAGSDETFQRMHRPKKPVTLDQICEWIPKIKAKNPKPRIGFSFIITWRGAERDGGTKIVENLAEIPAAAERARDARFDYISFKPFLTRRGDGAEVMDPAQAGPSIDAIVARIRALIEEAKAFATPTFKIVESTNLRVLETGSWKDLTRQPSMCHMQALRQVLTPLGLYNCPAHRGAPKAKIGAADAYASPERSHATSQATAKILEGFDASHECREVTCLYNGANWWLEKAIEDGSLSAADTALEREDWFL